MPRLLIATLAVLVLLVIGVCAWRAVWLREQRRLQALPSRARLAALTQMLQRVAAAADRSGARPFLMYGTLLGWRRDRRLICWDYDVDFGIDAADYDKMVSALRAEVAGDATFTVKAVDIPLVVKRTVLIHRDTGLGCDVFPLVRKGPSAVGHPRLMPLWLRHVGHERDPTYPAEHVYPLQRGTFLGSQVWLPRAPDRLLENWYGASYMTPNKTCPGCPNCRVAAAP